MCAAIEALCDPRKTFDTRGTLQGFLPAVLCLETASRLRRRDRVHNPEQELDWEVMYVLSNDKIEWKWSIEIGGTGQTFKKLEANYIDFKNGSR